MRWKYRANQAASKLKETVDVKTKIDRNSIPRIERGASSTPVKSQGYSDTPGEGLLYLLEHSELNAFKIGITSLESRNDRVEEHRLNGWETIEVWSLENMKKAYVVEQSVLNWWRKLLETSPAVKAEEMPQGGYSETISKSEVARNTILEFIYGQFGDSLVRPAMKLKISELKIGARTIIEGTVSVAVLDLIYTHNYNGYRKYSPIYRYKVKDETGEIVIESNLKRNLANAIDKDHIKVPVEGTKVKIEGRVLPLNPKSKILGMVDPLVVGPAIDPWSKDHKIHCAKCWTGRYRLHKKKYGRSYSVVLACSRCKIPMRFSDIN
jgi:hypothetical protein